MVSNPRQDADKAQAVRELKVRLRAKLDRAVENHNEVLKSAEISADFFSMTATVVGERLAQSALHIVFNSIIRDVAIANRLRIFAHQIEKVDVHYVDHESGETIAKTSKNIVKTFLPK